MSRVWRRVKTERKMINTIYSNENFFSPLNFDLFHSIIQHLFRKLKIFYLSTDGKVNHCKTISR